MSPKIKKLLILLSIIIAVVTVTITLEFVEPDINIVESTSDVIHEETIEYNPDTGESITSSYDYKFNENIAGIRITDIVNDIGAISKINYLPNEFASAGVAMKNSTIVDLHNTSFEYSNRGTIQLIILEPDPFSPTYKEDIKKLDKFKRGDYWCFTLQLPNIFTASNIYLGNKCVSSHGEIADYDFIKNSVSDNTTTDSHVSKVDSTLIELEYYTRREAMNPSMIAPSQIITIHYELNTNTINPINDFPVIGIQNKVYNNNVTNIRIQIILASLSIIVISIFLFIIFLKKKTIYMPLLLSSLGIFTYSISYICIFSGTRMPIINLTLYRISPIITMFTVLISVFLGFGKTKITKQAIISTIGMFFLVLLIPIILPFVSVSANDALLLTLKLVLSIISILTILLMVYGILSRDKKIEAYIIPLLISLSILVVAFYNRHSQIYFDSIFWILLTTTITTFAIFLKLFNTIEKENVYLTSNLKTEIDIHTTELIKALDERNRILQFVTHDLKKPTAYYINTLHKLETQITDEDQLSLISSLLDKSKEINESLKNLSELSKLNFLKEKLVIININDYLNEIYNSVKPDCDASGVYLTLNKMSIDVKVFGKVDGLKSTLLNIIFNALEHAECNEIKISVHKNKGTIQILIADDGKGIKKDIDIFQPYVSEIKGGSHGLGLYICKQAMDSMNGKIEYESSEAGTTFIVSLPQYVGNDKQLQN